MHISVSSALTHKHVHAQVFSLPSKLCQLDTLLEFDLISSLLCPTLWTCGSCHYCSGLTQSVVCGSPLPDSFLVCWKDWASVFVSDASCEEGKASFPSPLTFSSAFFLPMFALACACSTTEEFRLCYFCVGIFCSWFQMSTMDFFSKVLNCTSVPFSPENSELAPLPLSLFKILLCPGHFPFWLVMCILGFPWIPDFPGSKGSSLLAAHHPLTKEARLYCSAATETSVCPSAPENLLFQTSRVLLQLTSFLFLFLLPVFLLSPVLDCLLSRPWWGSAGTGPLLSLPRLPGHTPTSRSRPASPAQHVLSNEKTLLLCTSSMPPIQAWLLTHP